MALAIKLCDAGFDYWEDVDQYVRNELVEQQLLRADLLERISEAGPVHELDSPRETADRVIERNIGATAHFGNDPTMLGVQLGTASCCLQAGTQGLYHAWEGAVRHMDGAAQVNLLLNRASPWLDVDSYLPYEGKVVVANKTAEKVFLRVPRWVEKGAVRCDVNGGATSLLWLGNYLILQRLRAGDRITVGFPMQEEVVEYTSRARPAKASIGLEAGAPAEEEETRRLAAGDKYTLHFKGNTLVDISPRGKGVGYPIYLRVHCKADKAPTKKVVRYVSPIDLGRL